MRKLLLLIPFLIINGCKKEIISFDIVEIKSGTSDDLRSINSIDGKIIYITGGNATSGIILKSYDSGNNFTILNDDFKHRINDIDWYDSINGIAVANDFKAYATNNKGISWNQIWFDGFLSQEYQTHLLDVTVVNDSTVFFCGGWQFGKGVIGKSINKGQNWSYKPVDHEMRQIQFFDNLHGICVGYGAILRTENGGLSWVFGNPNNQFWTSITVKDNVAFASSLAGVIAKSNDLGKNWSILHSTNTILQNKGHFNSIHTIDGVNLITAGNNGSCYYSNNSGIDWKSSNSFGENTINAIKLSPFISGICVGNYGRIFLFHSF